MLAPDINQDIYELPKFLAPINSIWLDNLEIVFRQRYVKNDSHAEFILYLSNQLRNEKDIDELKKAIQTVADQVTFVIY